MRALEGEACSPVPERPALAVIKHCRVSKRHLPAEEIITLFGLSSDAGLPTPVLRISVVLPVEWGTGGEVEPRPDGGFNFVKLVKNLFSGAQ